MPPAYIQALLESENPFGAKPVHDFKIIREIVEEAHGRPLHDVFSEFSFVPVATGSIAQVHFAMLRESGAEVAVKVSKHVGRGAKKVWERGGISQGEGRGASGKTLRREERQALGGRRPEKN